MKKIITVFFGVMVLAGCTISPAQNSTNPTVPDGSGSGSDNIPTYVTATFIVGEGVDQIAPQTVRVGEKFNKPHDPEKEEYTFGGWFTDDSYSSLFNFDVSYTTDQTIYAKWDKVIYEYYLYGRLNDVDVFLPNDYKQEQYRLGTPHEDDSAAIKAIYNFHFMPDDRIHVIRFGSDDSEKIYDLDDSVEFGRGYYDLLLYENGISLRLIRYDEWVIRFLSDSDTGDVFASFTKGTSDGALDYYEANNIEVTAGQKLFLSYAWDYNPADYFGIMCENEWPIVNNEPWVEVIHTPSLLYPDATTTVYEFKKDAKYDVRVRVKRDCTYDNVKVVFSLIDDSEAIYQNGVFNLPAILTVWENYVKGNNSYQVDLVTGMLSARMSYESTKLIDISDEKFTFYLFAKNREMPNTPQFKTFEITCPTIISDIKNQMISTQTQLAAALYSVDAQYFNVTAIFKDSPTLGFDTSVIEEDAQARTVNLLNKVGSNADVIFAYETANESGDLTYGAGYQYRTVAYTSDSKLHVFSVSCLSKDDVLNDTDKYGVTSDNVTIIYEQNLVFYQDA